MEDSLLRFEHVTATVKGFCMLDTSFEMMPGYIYSIIGANGAGKTTLMKCIVNYKKIYTGRIFLEEKEVSEDHVTAMQKIGFISEDHRFFENRTGRQNAEILGGFYDHFNMDCFLTSMEEMKVSAGKTYKKMSRGEKLKFQLAFAKAYSPRLYLLDEATVGMDPVFRLELFDRLRQLIVDEKHGILMSSHNETEVSKNADFVGVMEKGIFSGFQENPE